MQIKNLNAQLVKLPADVELTLFLIREELKSCKLFNSLGTAGFHDSQYRPELSVMILEGVGFDDQPDDLLEYYVGLLNTYSNKLDGNDKKIISHAFNFYIDLLMEKRSRSKAAS